MRSGTVPSRTEALRGLPLPIRQRHQRHQNSPDAKAGEHTPSPRRSATDLHQRPLVSACGPAETGTPKTTVLEEWGGQPDNWGDISPTRMMRAVSVRGTESREELGALHTLAATRAASRLQRHKSLALAVWDGQFDLVPQRTRLNSVESVEHGNGRQDGSTDPTLWSSVPALSLALVVCGCGCQLSYELLNSSDRGCGALVSTCEALFGLVLTAPSALRQESWAVPVTTHAWLACAAVLYPLLLNQALSSKLPTVLLSTLKNGNLVANAIVGVTLLGKRYTAVQLVSIVIVSAGLVLTAIGGTPGDTSNSSGDLHRGSSDDQDVLFGVEGAVAVCCLSGAVLARALMGGLQEAAFARGGADTAVRFARA
jgi:hypothetical protein